MWQLSAVKQLDERKWCKTESLLYHRYCHILFQSWFFLNSWLRYIQKWVKWSRLSLQILKDLNYTFCKVKTFAILHHSNSYNMLLISDSFGWFISWIQYDIYQNIYLKISLILAIIPAALILVDPCFLGWLLILTEFF